MIYLLRHGRLEYDTKGLYIGQADIPLSEEGRSQAKQWRSRFEEQGIAFAAVYASDMSRCTETAEAASGLMRKNLILMPELREMNLGLWDGQAKNRIKEKFPNEWESFGTRTSFRPPEGESFAELTNRSLAAVEQIRSKEGINLVVTHAGVIRSIIGHILNINLERIFGLELSYAGLTVIDEKMRLLAVNRTIKLPTP